MLVSDKRGDLEISKLIGWTIAVVALVIVLLFVGWLVLESFPELVSKIVNSLRGVSR